MALATSVNWTGNVIVSGTFLQATGIPGLFILNTHTENLIKAHMIKNVFITIMGVHTVCRGQEDRRRFGKK
jgi:hypothetical protein